MRIAMKIFKTITEIAVVGALGGLLYVKYQEKFNNPQTTVTTSTVQNQADSLPTIHYDPTLATFNLVNNSHVIVQPTQQGNKKVIYYKITGNGNDINIWQQAINNWNSLKIIHLEPLPDGSHYQYINLHGNITDYSYGDLIRSGGDSDDVRGTTTQQFTFTSNSPYSPAYAKDTACYLYTDIAECDPTTQVNIATHELGHALGFGHDVRIVDGKHVIMNPTASNNLKPLGNYEAKALQAYYK